MKKWLSVLGLCVLSALCAYLTYTTSPPTVVLVMYSGMMYIPPIMLLAKVWDYAYLDNGRDRWRDRQ